jgi:hypothetical protein
VVFPPYILDSLRWSRHFLSHAHHPYCPNRKLSSSVWLGHRCGFLPAAGHLDPVVRGYGDMRSRRGCFGTSKEVRIGLFGFKLTSYIPLSEAWDVEVIALS